MNLLRNILALLFLVTAIVQEAVSLRRIHNASSRHRMAGRFENVLGEGRFAVHKLVALKAALTSTTTTTTTTTAKPAAAANPNARFTILRPSSSYLYDFDDLPANDYDWVRMSARQKLIEQNNGEKLHRFMQQQEQIERLLQQQQEQQLRLEKQEQQLRIREQAIDEAINLIRLQLGRERLRHQEVLWKLQPSQHPYLGTRTSDLVPSI